MSDPVNNPSHYGGVENPYEAIKVIEAWGLDFCLGNTIKYIARAGRKDPGKVLEDLRKARWYLDRRIGQIEELKVAMDAVEGEGERYQHPLPKCV